MAGFKIMLSLLVLISATFAGSNDCPERQEVSCERLRSSKGFTYTLPISIPCPDCEQGWYDRNGICIASPEDSGERSPLVEDVTSTTLTIKSCENIQWQLLCAKCPMIKCFINYTVADQAPREIKQDDNHHDSGKEFPAWGTVLIVIGGVLIITIIIIILVLRFKNGRPNQGVV